MSLRVCYSAVVSTSLLLVLWCIFSVINESRWGAADGGFETQNSAKQTIIGTWLSFSVPILERETHEKSFKATAITTKQRSKISRGQRSAVQRITSIGHFPWTAASTSKPGSFDQENQPVRSVRCTDNIMKESIS